MAVIQFWQRNCYGTDVNMRISVAFDEQDNEHYIVVVITKGEFYQEWFITEEGEPEKTVEEIGNQLTKFNVKLN